MGEAQRAATGRMSHWSGRVVGEQGGLLIRTAQGAFRAEVAVSCLVSPQVGDAVLLALEEEGAAFVLAVLQRASHSPLPLALAGDVSLRAEGRLTLAAGEGLELASGHSLGLRAGMVEVDANTAEVRVGRANLFAQVASTVADVSRTVAERVETMAGWLRVGCRRSTREVEETDAVKAGQIDYRAEDELSLSARYTLVTAEELAKVDAEQIHLG